MLSDSLADTQWDVVIEGTGLSQSLLALALSRSGKKILHIDHNEYYGGNEASLGLVEAVEWAAKYAGASTNSRSSTFSYATVNKPEHTGDVKLGRPRAYELSLAPQLLYSRSMLLDIVVSSQIHNQLDFQAVGSWFVVDAASSPPVAVPGSREDIFRDDKIDMRAKRSLMKLLRSLNAEEPSQDWHPGSTETFTHYLEHTFSLPSRLHAPLLALTMSPQPSKDISAGYAIPRITRHLRSIGVHAPGCPVLLQRYGGLAEIIQVACRANAVSGGTYVLGQGASNVHGADEDKLIIELTGGDRISTSWYVGAEAVESDGESEQLVSDTVSRSISIIGSRLSALFQPLAAGTVTPAGAIILIPGENETEPPVYIFAHSSDSGECPSGQSILYASVASDHQHGLSRLNRAVEMLLRSASAGTDPPLLWSLQYQQQFTSSRAKTEKHAHEIKLRALSPELVLDNSIVDSVKAAWIRIAQPEDSESFMKFAPRDGTMDDEDDGS